MAGKAEDSREQEQLEQEEERVDSAYVSASLGELLLEEEAAEEAWSPEERDFLSTVTEDGDTVLHLAIIHEEQDFAEFLMELFPPELLDVQNNLFQVTAVWLWWCHFLCVCVCVQTALHLAVFLQQEGVVKTLLMKRASPLLQDREGNTPLHVACHRGFWDCASEMLRHASSRLLHTQNWGGLTCLHVATQRQHHRLMRLLIKSGADLNAREGTSGRTALHVAVEMRDVTAATLLITSGADVDAAMFNGSTPLHLAIGRQDHALTNLLCQAGADLMIRNMECDTPLDLADGNQDILALFPFDDIQIMGRTVSSF